MDELQQNQLANYRSKHLLIAETPAKNIKKHFLNYTGYIWELNLLERNPLETRGSSHLLISQ